MFFVYRPKKLTKKLKRAKAPLSKYFDHFSYELTRRNNITVYAIGVGNHVTRDQLKISANGGVSDERVLTPENYDALSRQLQNLTREISRTSAEGFDAAAFNPNRARPTISLLQDMEAARTLWNLHNLDFLVTPQKK